MAKLNDITIYRGQFKDLLFTLDPVEDITGWEIEFMVRPGYGKLPIEIHKGVMLGGIIILDGPGGVFRVRLHEQDSACLLLGDHVHDCQRTDATPGRDPLSIGLFTLLDLVNRVECL